VDSDNGIYGVSADCAERTVCAGVDDSVAERCLGHVIGGVRGTYDWHKYYDEKKLAFEKLATLIENIVDLEGECAANEGEKAAHLIFNDGSAWGLCR
jgi:hypothetical protein